MLERTSACLDTGVRLSLRQTSLASKSRRLLHNSFWSTQAPDVDHGPLYNKLSSSAVQLPSSPAAAQLPSSDSHDAPFLDFLYPAPTQLFMTRLSQSERWSRKNTRPNVLRGYSSLTTQRDSSSSSPSDYSRTPQNLLTLLESPIATGSLLDLDIERTWALLTEIPKPDPGLLCRAIAWFSATQDKSADQHAVDLFANLPTASRSPQVYRDVISSNLRLGRQSLAFALHKTASSLPRAGHIASGVLMATAIFQSDWPLAVAVLQQWEAYTASTPSPHDASNFWNEVTRNLPDTLARLNDLRELCRKEIRRDEANATTHELQRLHGLLMNRFIVAQSRHPVFMMFDEAGNIARRNVRHLINTTFRTSLASADLYERVLITLLTLPGCASNRNCSSIVVKTYMQYRKSKHFAPSEDLLDHITVFWGAHNLAFAGKGPDTNFIGKDRILSDWNQYHGKPSDKTLVNIMHTFAQRGFVKAVKEHADLYKSLHPSGDLKPGILWPLLTVHAVNYEPSLAAQQLHSMKEEYGVTPDLRCWNIVIHAYVQIDDLRGATRAFRQLLDAKLKPDDYTYASLLNAYAKGGDIDGVIDLLSFARSHGVTKPTTHMLNCTILALTQSSEMDGAMKALDQTIQAVQQDRAEGSLTLCFNTMLTAFAWRRNLQATLDIYRRMKEQNVPLDQRSYGALMLVLCLFRQSQSAERILKKVMPAGGIRPTAFHYAILTSGYLNQEMYQEAIQVEKEMDKRRVRKTVSSRAVALRAKTLYEHSISLKQEDESEHSTPLKLAIEDFQRVLDKTRTFREGLETMDVSHLIYIHGQRRSFEAVQHLFQMFQKKFAKTNIDQSHTPIVLLLTDLMFVHSQAEEWDEVDKYWILIKSQVDEVRLSQVPASDLIQSVERGFEIRVQQKAEKVQIPASHRFVLSQPLLYYIRSQFAQSSIRKLVPTMEKLLSQGFRFANVTWNELIVQLCQASPPRALLAYTLVEQYMIKDWPGWYSAKHSSIRRSDLVFLKRQDNKGGLQYINARYIGKEQLIPQYRTMVYLASALLEVRGLASRGLSKDANESGLRMSELRKQVGTIPDIREQAPKTLHAIQSMPRIVDRLQGNLLRSQ